MKKKNSFYNGKNVFMKFFLLAFIMVFAGNLLKAQQIEKDTQAVVIVCTQVLKDAQKAYDGGRISQVPGMLEGCLKEGFTKSEKLQALRLVILCALFQDEYEKAESTLLELLKEDPEYKVNEVLDPAEFINLYNTYRTLPVVSIGVAGGTNRTSINEIESFSTDNVNASKAKYKAGYGYQFGAVADIFISKKMQLNAGLFFSGKKYKMNRDTMFGYTTLSLIESQSWLELPLALKYNFRKVGIHKFIPFVVAGVSGNLFLSSNGNISRKSNEGKDIDASGPAVQMTDLRNKFNYSAVLGAGARYKIGYGYIMLDIRYNLGLHNVVNVKNRYSNNELIYYYGHIDSNYRLNNISVSFGYLKSLYKPKKIKTKNE